MEKTCLKPLTVQDEMDLRLIRKMKQYADEGYDVEFRKDRGGGYKTLKCKKQIFTAD